MGIIVSLIVGAIAGWLAGTIVKGEGYGLIVNIIVGMIGGFLGQLLLEPLGIESTNVLGSIIVATFGSLVLILVLRAIIR